MKKIIISILLLLGTFSMASAEIGLKLGISGNIGLFEATGFETEAGEKNGTGTAGVDKAESIGAMGSVFVEKTLTFLPGPLSRLSIGYDHVVHKIQTGTSSRRDIDLVAKTLGHHPQRTGDNKAAATIDNINTLYLTARITDWLFIRAGSVEADVETQESLFTGSKYGNTTVDGTVYGIGVEHKSDNGFFMRAEWNSLDLDGNKLTSTTNSANSITLTDITGESARLSVGKEF
jgi:hypothetical protein